MNDDMTNSEKAVFIPLVVIAGVLLSPVAVLVYIGLWTWETIISVWEDA